MILFKSYSRSSDAELVRLVSEGDEAAFGELLCRYQEGVYSFALRMLGDAAEAEDVAQETFLRLYTASGRYRPEASLKTFLFRIARNLCIDYFRKKRPCLMDELPEQGTDQTPLDHLQKAIEKQALETAISELPVNQKAALLLRHSGDMTYAGIAETLELSVSAVESLLVRARRNLFTLLAEKS